MLKVLIFLLGLLIGGVAGGGFVLFYFPFWFPPAEVNEQIANVESKRVVGSGTFIHPDPSDSVHWGKGKVRLYESEGRVEVYLTEDFEVGPGPDYHVYLVDRRDILEEDHFTAAGTVEIGRLKSFKGSQIYSVAQADLNLETDSVVVWCKQFGQLITSANLEP